MKLVPYDIDKVSRHIKRTKLLAVLEEFDRSGLDCVKVEDHDYGNAKSGVNAFNVAAKRFGMMHIHAIQRKGMIFLIREDI